MVTQMPSNKSTAPNKSQKNPVTKAKLAMIDLYPFDTNSSPDIIPNIL